MNKRERKAQSVEAENHQEVEPLTGSAAYIQKEDMPEAVPNNGFPVGYGPNAGMKRVEKPKKPSFRERWKRSIQKLTKKQKIVILVVLILLVLAGIGVAIYITVSGVFRVDYSATYSIAKELRGEMQKLRSNASCDKVADYVDNAYTSMQIYQSYVEECKEVGAGVASEIVTALGDTEGVLKDTAIAAKYNAFSLAMDQAKKGNKNVDKTLDLYTIWHSWIIAESTGDASHNWEWTETDIETAADILQQSGDKDLVAYADDWTEYKKAAATATYNYYHTAIDSSANLKEQYEDMQKTQEAFAEFKKKKEPKITKILPLDMVDTAALYEKFSSMYDLIRETYQNNYNYTVGGCKEMVGSVICD